MAKKSKTKFGDFFWEDLEFPKEWINTPEGKVPLEVYVNDNKVTFKVTYEQTKEIKDPYGLDGFSPETTICDYGFIFENKLEIKGVAASFWNKVSIPTGTEMIVKKVRPKVNIAPKLKKGKPKKKKDGTKNK